MHRLTRRSLLLASAAWLTGCGFALRQAPRLGFDSIYLALPEASALGLELRRQLAGLDGLRLITDPAQREQAQVILESPGDQRQRVVVSTTAAGEVREVTLRLRFAFRATDANGRELLPRIELERQIDQSWSETAALSKEQEAAMLYASMQSDIVQQVLVRLASISI